MSIPYFGRIWRLTVTSRATGQQYVTSNLGWDTESLRCTFKIRKAVNFEWWFADIVLWNCQDAMNRVFAKHDTVVLEAGYQSPGMETIWSGELFQPLWEKRDEDFLLTLHCVVGMWEDETGQISCVAGAGVSYYDAVVQAAKKAAIQIDYVDPILDTKELPRGWSMYGPARMVFDDAARNFDNMLAWMGPNGLNIRPMASKSDVPDVIYAPPFSPATQTASASGVKRNTLIGTPQQTEMGVAFRVMLDGKVDLTDLVQLESVLQKRLPQMPMQLFVKYNPDGVFAVMQIEHEGDTRGPEWHTTVTAVVRWFEKTFETVLGLPADQQPKP